MNKKGFTLAELLGSIIILGIVVLIVFPIVNNSIKNSREKAYDEQKNIVLRSAKKWGVKNSTKLSQLSPTYVSIDELINGGFIEKTKVINPVTNEEMNGCVVIRYNTTFNKYDYEYSEVTCDEEQRDKPLITLNGDSSVFITVGSVYEDAGATGSYRGNYVTDSISVSNNIDTSKIGTYYVKYNLVYDGKSAIEVVRTVTVECPSIALMNTTIKSCDTMTNDPDQNLRFVGPTPNNYVKFNNELWRIIGVFDGQAKIIRNEFYSLNGNTTFEWDDNSDGSKTHNWATASLQLALNNTTDGYITTIQTNDPTSYSYIDLEHVWNVGGTDELVSSTREDFYYFERGEMISSYMTSHLWTGAVGIIYPSDYGYSTSGDLMTCDSVVMNQWYSNSNVTAFTECAEKSWLNDDIYIQWTLTPSTNGSTVVYAFRGGLGRNLSSQLYAASPVLYLKSNVKIVSGLGTVDEPFELGA